MDKIEHLNLFDQSFHSVEQYIQELLHVIDNEDEKTADETCEYYNSLAYSIGSIYYMYLKLYGINTNKHPLNNEMKRIKEYILKLSKIKK